jgi:signal transduction histidine kinase
VGVGHEPERTKATRPARPRGHRNGADRDITRKELEQLLQALHEARDGDFQLRLPIRGKGIAAELNRAFNELAERSESFGKEVTRVGRVTERASAASGAGNWTATLDARQDLVATVSHELRTPLAAIYGSALTLRRGDVELDDELRDKLLEVIAVEAARLAEIVDDLLLTSQLDSGQLTVKIERCDPIEIARQKVESARTHVPENVELSFDAPGRLPPVAADPSQLGQVLSNLLDNAVKYSPEGGAISVELSSADRHVRFAVSDRGLGVPAAERERIFEKFYRLDPGMSRGIGGTGLGLYICRELVRRVGGRIWVEQGQGAGSRFVVEIPREQARAKAGRNGRAPTSATSR